MQLDDCLCSGTLAEKINSVDVCWIALNNKKSKIYRCKGRQVDVEVTMFPSVIHETCVSRSASIVESFMSIRLVSLTLVFADWFKSGLCPTRATRPSKPENLEWI